MSKENKQQHICMSCLHLQSNKTHIQTDKTEQLKGKQQKTLNKKTEISQPEPERYLFAVGSRAGYPVFLFFMLFFELSVFVMFLSVVFMFSPSLFKLLHLQSKNTYKHINKQNNSKENRKTLKQKQ